MILGVTGGIATGKSFVCSVFREMGAPVVSADEIAREVVQPGTETLRQLIETFGQEILLPDGHLDRQYLGNLIFADKKARSRLNSIIHPAIARCSEEQLQQTRYTHAPLVIYEAPLLFEANAQSRVDKILVVTAKSGIQLQRLMEREQINRHTAEQRIKSQLPLQDKIAKADYLIDNSGDRKKTRRECLQLFNQLTGVTQCS